MATTEQVLEYRQANQSLVALAQSDLRDLWQALSGADPVQVRDELLRFFPELVQTYGDTAAVLGADWYDTLRDVPASASSFNAVLANPVPTEQAQQSARWAVGPLFDGDSEGAFSNLSGSMQRLIMQPGRESFSLSASRDSVRTPWARVPSGGSTCKWCVMLASRGAVYSSASDAGQMNEFHDNCDCVQVPLRSRADIPDGYDRKFYERLYQEGSGIGRDIPQGGLLDTSTI